MTDSSPICRTWGELTLDEFFEIARLRTEVFYLEQRIDDIELDEFDRAGSTEHWFLTDDSGVAAYLRVLVHEVAQVGDRDARHIIGRVATRAGRRRGGLSRRLLDAVIARHGAHPMALHAQVAVRQVYAAVGFEPYGDEYDEAGIVHIGMYRPAQGLAVR
ncbi:MAG: GNAT family N-acetyltransferase [Microcella sp.]|nr:GNAT family N-acetyltransferase [Microcella sp.]